MRASVRRAYEEPKSMKHVYNLKDRAFDVDFKIYFGKLPNRNILPIYNSSLLSNSIDLRE